MWDGMFDEFFELEFAVRQDERALHRVVQILCTMAGQVDPFTSSHFVKYALDGTFRVFNDDKADCVLVGFPGYQSNLLPGAGKQ